MNSRICDRLFPFLLLALAAFTVFFELWRMDVVSDNEGQRATPPAEMLRRGDFVMPSINGKDYLAKPPLLYWAIASVYSVTGVISPFTARIPGALCFCALILLIYFYARKVAGENAGRLAALIYVASPYIVESSRTADLDTPLTLTTFAAMLLLREACLAATRGRMLRSILFGGLCLGAAIMLKGPVPFLFVCAAWLAILISEQANLSRLRKALYWSIGGLLFELLLIPLDAVAPGLKPKFPVALVVVTLIWIGYAWRYSDARKLRSLGVLLATLAVGIACAVPWALAVLYREGWPYVSHLLHSEVFERTYQPGVTNMGDSLFYFYGLVGVLAPWGLLLPCHASKAWFGASGGTGRFHLFTGWLSVLVFSLVAGKENEYILPAVPFLVIVCAAQLASGYRECEPWVRKAFALWSKAIPALLTLIAAAFVFSFARYQDSTLVCELSVLGLAGAAAGILAVRNNTRLGAVAIAMLCISLGRELVVHSFKYHGEQSFQAVARKTGDLLRKGLDVEALKMTRPYDVYPAFAFYAATTIPTVTDAEHIKQKLAGPTPYYCVLRQDMMEAAGFPAPSDRLRVLMGPYTKKEVVLLGNTALPE